ncbi:MAG: YHS domain protein [Rhodobacteraceae bacterium]|nr:YHS domain protein [Paracoccaceae bacterium]
MITRRTALALMGATIASPVLANRPEIYKGHDSVAVNGYDVVGYFTDGAHVQGLPEFSTDWMGAIWQFSNAANRDMFAANPEAYAPQYGGHCAYAASKDALASTVPEAWTIVGGKLYLNFSLGVRDLWRQDISRNIALADGFWPGLHA